jgi:hypothetical protein
MQIVGIALKAAACLIGILLTCDVLLTLHDIRNELRASREEREAQNVPNHLF